MRIGTLLARRYRIERLLGSGGMGSTYAARDLMGGEELALKLLSPRSREMLDQFRQEFTRLRGVYHPRLVAVRDFVTDRGETSEPLTGEGAAAPRYFYTAELVRGQALRPFAAKASWADVRRVVIDALEALRLLHALNIAHGDIKPDNILVDHELRGKLIDLSCSRPLYRAHGVATLSGTPGFIAPELRDGRPADARADLYALGVTLAELARGRKVPASVPRVITRLTDATVASRPTDVAEVIELLGGTPLRRALHHGLAPRFVGRDDQLGSGAALLERFVAGAIGPRALCIIGARGVGKSRLLQELKWEAELRCATSELTRTASEPLDALLRCAGAPGAASTTLDGVLTGAAHLRAGPNPSVLVLDDIDTLAEHEHALVQALLRSLTTDGRLFILCSARSAPDVATAAEVMHGVALEALGAAAVAEWALPAVAERDLGDLLRLTGGFPAYLEWALARLAGGSLTVAELGATTSPVGERVIAELVGLAETAEQQRVLALLGALGGELDQQRWNADLAPDAVEWLLREGCAVKVDGVLRLVRGADAHALARALPPALMQRAHGEVADRCMDDLTERAGAPVWGRALQHLVLAGRTEEAATCFDKAEGATRAERGELAAYLGPLARASTNPMTLLRVAAHYLAGAKPRSALSAVARVRRVRGAQLQHDHGAPSVDDLRAVYVLGAQCNLRVGQLRAVERHARRAEALARTAEERAEVADLRSRASIHAGAHQLAREIALPWIDADLTPALEARLRESVGVAASFLGDSRAARRELAAAVQLQQQSGSARDLARALSYQGIVELRDGQLAQAAAAHRQALEVSEREELTDMIATTCLNWAATCQQMGDLGAALQGYERGLELARALGRINTVITLEYNLANLYAEIGSFDRAREAAKRAEHRAGRAGLRHVDGSLAVLQGELSMLEQQWPSAVASFERARAIYVDLNAARELAEVELALAAVALDRGDLDRAGAHLSRVEGRVLELEAADLTVRAQLTRARLAHARHDTEDALAMLQAALGSARRSGQRPLEAEVESVWARTLTREGRVEPARQHRLKARRLWDRIGASLPQHMIDAFWRHPRRVDIAESHGPALEPAASGTSRELARLMAINRRLNSTLSVAQVLNATIDAAIELTGAERGFVLLRQGNDLEIAVMQNLDRHRLSSEQMLFSRGIAERVVESELPILATDAGSDERFAHHVSVHAIKLQSVACVPILCQGETLGALYLDNRMVRGRFTEADLQVLMGFAEQAAMALNNARLHTALEQRTRELEEAKRKVDRLLRVQQSRIETLTGEVRTRQRLLEHRYSYEQIAGRGQAMRGVLDVLDRVIGSDVTVLVQGESGTGKELVARAIHFNGPRAKAPFVGINCGALSESLLESELFGHVRGAFTGATTDKRGLFVEAHQGTLFLDEVGEMSLALQVKLLRALQEREVRPVGATSTTRFDVRLVCATNRDLRAEVEEGRFREDLYYRLSVVEVTVPPLRERIEDLPAIAKVILHRLAERDGTTAPRLAPDALRLLASYGWPGNVRQLENVLTRAYVLLDGPAVRAEDIVLPRSPAPGRATRSRAEYQHDESQRILAALRSTRWNISEVSRALRIPRNTLYRKMKRYGLEAERG